MSGSFLAVFDVEMPLRFSSAVARRALEPLRRGSKGVRGDHKRLEPSIPIQEIGGNSSRDLPKGSGVASPPAVSQSGPERFNVLLTRRGRALAQALESIEPSGLVRSQRMREGEAKPPQGRDGHQDVLDGPLQGGPAHACPSGPRASRSARS